MRAMGDRARHIASLFVMLGFTLMLAATSKAKKPDDAPPAPSAKNAPAVHGSGVPADVDIVLVTSATGCDKKPAHAGCKLLKEFDGAEPYVDMPKTKVVWYGESIGLGGAGDAKVEPFFVQVAPTATGFGAAARTLIPENAKEKKDATDLLAAAKTGRSMPASDAAKFMRDAPPPHGMMNIVLTKGRSHALVETPTKVFLRRSGNRLLVLEHSGSPLGHDGTGAAPATAWIAETWLVP
jgi:hypothetical protein